jgi:biofilm PGA synthesis lipoprotein PgaB
MPKRFFIWLAILFYLCLSGASLAEDIKAGEFLVLSYHSVSIDAASGDDYSIDHKRFVEQMEYLRTHGYSPVSMDDILEAAEGRKALPDKPVLLTFDDAYVSYYDLVVPILREFGYPSVLGVVGSFIDNQPPKGLPEPLMTWEQIKEVASMELVEVISHTYGLHKGIQYNPPGNVWAAAVIRAYDPDKKTYETKAGYIERIKSDFNVQEEAFLKHLGFKPRGIVWPYGMYTKITVDEAKKRGMRFCLTLDEGYAGLDSIFRINRVLVQNRPIEEFIRLLSPVPAKEAFKRISGEDHVRAAQVDLDLIYDSESYEKTDYNLGRLIDRLVEMKVNTVFLQAFADPEGTGDIKSVYFHNEVLPVRADIFSHAAHQMAIRDMMVYAWMPTLSIVLPDKELNDSLRVIEKEGEAKRQSTSWYQRLTPFSDEVGRLVRGMYEDLAAHSRIHGILFQDDAYLTDHEDFHPLAVSAYRERFGNDPPSGLSGDDPESIKNWTDFKTGALISFTDHLMEGVLRYRPNTLFARNMYASVLTDPESEEWFAQNYERFLGAYDQVVIMAYPQMEKVKNASEWFEDMVKKVKEYPLGLEKTVFKVQSYDWEKSRWIKDRVLLKELRDILVSGGRHLAYYPDNVWEGRPSLKTIKLEMSSETYPFMP